jgi:hypothetical protein
VVAALAAASVAFLHGGNLVVVNTATHAERVVMQNAGSGPVRWSGDGRLVSSGGKIAGGPTLPTGQLTWAPTGERAAYVTKQGALYVWSRSGGSHLVVPRGWGAQAWQPQGIAWSNDGRLAIGRTVCHRPCGVATHVEVWVWTPHSFRRIARLPDGAGVPMPFTWDGRGRVLWWLWPNSGSIAADGVAIYANSTKIASGLMFSDYVSVCGRHLALAVGHDRNTMHGKSIVFDGRNVSRDPSRSWVSPSCNAQGSLVAAADPDNTQGPWGREHRAIWQLLPQKRRLTSPPRGWTDESPTVLRDGSVLFVRTRDVSHWTPDSWHVTEHGTLELLSRGKLTAVADVTVSSSDPGSLVGGYYGHYSWTWRLAVHG